MLYILEYTAVASDKLYDTVEELLKTLVTVVAAWPDTVVAAANSFFQRNASPALHTLIGQSLLLLLKAQQRDTCGKLETRLYALKDMLLSQAFVCCRNNPIFLNAVSCYLSTIKTR
jgi:hypothetical protein